MKNYCSIHQVKSNNSPIPRLKLETSIKKCNQLSNQLQENQLPKNKIFTLQKKKQLSQYQNRKQFEPHLQKIHIQYYDKNEKLTPYAYTTKGTGIQDNKNYCQKQYRHKNITLQNKIKSLNQACLTESLSNECWDQNPQIQNYSQIQSTGYYSPYQLKGRPFTFAFQFQSKKKNIDVQSSNIANSYGNEDENLMMVSLDHQRSRKKSSTSLISSLININQGNQYKQKKISESLIVYDLKKSEHENQKIQIIIKNAETVQKSKANQNFQNDLKSKQSQIINKIQTCKTSQITQPNSINSKNECIYNPTQYIRFDFFQNKNVQVKRRKGFKIRVQTLQNQTQLKCLLDNDQKQKRQYNSADAKFRKLTPKKSVEKLKKQNNRQQKIKKQVKLALSKNLCLQKDLKLNKLKLRDKKQQQCINKIHYKNYQNLQEDQDQWKNFYKFTDQQRQESNFCRLKKVQDLKKLKKKWSKNESIH